MDPLSIADAAVSISATCIEVAKAVFKYADEVKNVNDVFSLFGQDLTTLSKALDSVHMALRKHDKSLSKKLGDQANLLDSLSAW